MEGGAGKTEINIENKESALKGDENITIRLFELLSNGSRIFQFDILLTLKLSNGV